MHQSRAGAAEPDPEPSWPGGDAGWWHLAGERRGQSQYVDGKWIDIDYGRPILRQRENIFGSGAEYGQRIYGGAPIWRVGANLSTRFKTEVPLMFGGNRLDTGEYSMFIDLRENDWTLVFSAWGAKQDFREENPNAIFGANGYTDEKDVLRAPMTVSQTDVSMDQLVLAFADVKQDGGTLVVWWDTTRATIDFIVAQ